MYSLTTRKYQRGDTLIEVLVSMAVLGAIVTIAYGVMNRGFATSQNSLDRTATQALLSGQSAMLRAAHARALDGERKYWDAVVAKTAANTSEYNAADLPKGCASSLNNRANLFYFDPSSAYDNTNPAVNGPLAPKSYYTAFPYDPAKLVRQATSPKLGDGMWIEGHRDASNFYTFYIKSCWNASYGDGTAALREAKTVVRLYAP